MWRLPTLFSNPKALAALIVIARTTSGALIRNSRDARAATVNWPSIQLEGLKLVPRGAGRPRASIVRAFAFSPLSVLSDDAGSTTGVTLVSAIFASCFVGEWIRWFADVVWSLLATSAPLLSVNWSACIFSFRPSFLAFQAFRAHHVEPS